MFVFALFRFIILGVYIYIYILDLHMTPSGVMLHVCKLVAENLHRKLKEYHRMNVSAAAAAAV